MEYVKYLCLIFFTICLEYKYTNAQTHVFAQLSGSPINTTGWTLQGSAKVGNVTGTNNSEIIISPAVNYQTGAIFFDQPINLSQCSKWIAAFDFRIYDGSSADGLAFCFLDTSPNGYAAGGALGIPANANGLKVCFDQNSNCVSDNPSNMPKIEIRWGAGYNECWNQPTADNSTGALSFIRSPTYNHAKIVYNKGVVQVYVNDKLYVTGNQQFNFTGYMGFTAATGGKNDSHSIKNVVIYTEMPEVDAGQNQTICSGESVKIGSTPTAQQLYLWSPSTGLNATNIANPEVTLTNVSNAPIFQKYYLRSAYTYSSNCFSNDSVIVKINPGSSVSILASDSVVCSGTPITFSAKPVNAGANPSYQWLVNGTSIGSNSSTFTSSSIKDKDMVRCTLENAFCKYPLSSNSITLSVTAIKETAVTINASSANICTGTPVTFTAAATGGSSYKYQWKKNGATIGINSATYLDSNLKNNDNISCVIAASGTCISSISAASNIIKVNVSPKLTASVAIQASANSICPGTAVTFTAIPTNAGASPKYQWIKNGQPQGGNAPTYTDKTLNKGDVIRCSVQSSDACTDQKPVSSNDITMQVNDRTAPPVNLGKDTLVCANSLLLNAHAGYTSYRWQDGSTDSTFLVKTSGVYAVQVTDGCNHPFNSSVKVSLNAAKAIELGPDKNICSGDTLNVKGPDGFNHYQWSVGGTTIATDKQQIIVFPQSTTTYIATAQSTTGCTSKGSLTVKLMDKIIINLGADTAICKGDSLLLNAGVGFVSYNWSTGSSKPFILVKAAGSYNIMAKNQNGCYSYDTLTILKVNPLPLVSLSKDYWLCENTTRVLDAGRGFSSYAWNTGSASQTIPVTTTGMYKVEVSDQNGCKGSDVTYINKVQPQPSNFLPSDTAVCQYSKIELAPSSGFASYLWSTGEHTKAIEVMHAGSYALEVVDSLGCRGSSQTAVREKQCLEGLYVPNAFTPNGDGKNDIFKPMLFGDVQNYHLIIYDRWGKKVFETYNPEVGWDGTFSSKPQDTGTYVWICKYTIKNAKEKIEKGTVTIIH